MTDLLQTARLSFGYERRALTDPVDLELHAGELLVVLGPNGSGKSTLFRTLLGAVRPISGSVRWGGRSIAELKPRELAACVAWVPQHPGVAFEFTVEEYVMLGRLGRLPAGAAPGAADRDAVARAIGRLGLDGFVSRSLSRMSGGERQLAAIARALAQEASTLVLDEPTTSLDFGNQGRVLDTLLGLAADGLGIVYSTHDPNHARRAGTRALVYLPGGRMLVGAVDELVEPRTLSRVYGVEVDGARTSDGRLVLAVASGESSRARTTRAALRGAP